MLYALCPLVLTAFSMEGHVDSLMLLFVALAMLADVSGVPPAAGAALGLAISAKLTAVVLLPWLVIRHPKAALVCLGVVALTYVPYLDAGAGLFESLARFAAGPPFFDLLGTIGLPGVGTSTGRALRAVVLVGVVVWLAVRRRRDLSAHGLGATGAMLMLMPVVHPWYLTWVLLFVPGAVRVRGGDPAACAPMARGVPFAWLLTGAAMVCYYEAAAGAAGGGGWLMPAWAPRVAWGVFGAGVLGELAAITWARRCSRRRGSPS